MEKLEQFHQIKGYYLRNISTIKGEREQAHTALL